MTQRLFLAAVVVFAASACGQRAAVNLTAVSAAALQRGVERASASGGFVLVADTQGQILARAGTVPETIDPASLYKPLLVERALRQGAISPAEVIDCGPKDANAFDRSEALTAVQTIARSSNRCARRIAERLGMTDGAGCVRPEVLLEQYAELATSGHPAVREGLRQAVLVGTGKNADSSLVMAAGKTATSVGTSTDCSTGQRVASFAGFAPADDPELVVLVSVIEPRSGLPLGGHFAAPVFREVVEAALGEN